MSYGIQSRIVERQSGYTGVTQFNAIGPMFPTPNWEIVNDDPTIYTISI
jgi:hypothetical protein